MVWEKENRLRDNWSIIKTIFINSQNYSNPVFDKYVKINPREKRIS